MFGWDFCQALMMPVVILTSSGEPQKATLTSTGLFPPNVEVAAGALFEHPEFTIIKEQATKTKIEDLMNRISKPFILRRGLRTAKALLRIKS